MAIQMEIPGPRPFDAAPLMYGSGPAGRSIAVNARYLLRDGRPWYPLAGEMHYARCPRRYWDESLWKMKAAGLGALSTYVFWIHHEESEGRWDWSGDRDLRAFLRLCARRRLLVLLRIGPWSHGECRNGGFPDWLMAKPFVLRSNDARYLDLVRRLYGQVHRQARGLLFRDGGPIIGVQLENEYGHCGGYTGAEGAAHMRALKELALEAGFSVPLYTATGWGGAVVLQGETIPVMSAYAAAPWTQHSDPLPPNRNYLFSSDRNDLQAGSDLAAQWRAACTFDPEKNPYLMAELGPGIQVTRHRRPIVTAHDVEALVLTKIGSGANMLGYYMFHGGTHPAGKLSSLQESRETGSPNEVPAFSYDFQAPIGEFGQVRDTYRFLKILHLFLNDFGEQVARSRPVLPGEQAGATEHGANLQYALRAGEDAGFLFVNQHRHGQPPPSLEGIPFVVRTGSGEVRFPAFPLAGGRCLIFPFNLRLRGLLLRWATAQLLCRLEHQAEEYWFFFSYPEIPPQYHFEGAAAALTPEPGEVLSLRDREEKVVRIVTLTRDQAEHCWKGPLWGRQRIVLSGADLQFRPEGLLLAGDPQRPLDFRVFPAPDNPVASAGPRLRASAEPDGLFTRYRLQRDWPRVEVQATPCGTPMGDWGEWQLGLDREALAKLEDLFLRIDFSGDTAELYVGDKIVADCYYTGLPWEIGLKRFRPLLTSRPQQPLRLRIRALRQETPVYLERPCRFVDGKALVLHSVNAVPLASFLARCGRKGVRISIR
jgi:hypothetical protein